MSSFDRECAAWCGMGARERGRVAVMESAPARALLEDPEWPVFGGSLVFAGDGGASCWVCGWRGVATVVEGVISTWCPVCRPGRRPECVGERAVPSIGRPKPKVLVVPRNVPCPCGSGLKAKRCGCEAYAV